MTITRTTLTADTILNIVENSMPEDSRYYLQPYQNGREHGWALINLKTHKQTCFSEFRRSDNIVLYCGKTLHFDDSGNIPHDDIYDSKTLLQYNAYGDAAIKIIEFLESE